jgi:hypothetical protein
MPGFSVSGLNPPNMFYGASLGAGGGAYPAQFLQPAPLPQVPAESALLRGARLAASFQPAVVIPGSDDPAYQVKGPFFASDRILMDGVGLRYQFDVKALWNPSCKCPRGSLWADNILAFASHQRSLFALAADKLAPPKDDKLVSIAAKAWADEFNAAALKAVVAAFLPEGSKPELQMLQAAAKIQALVKADVPLVSWDYFDGLVKELYADYASTPLADLKITPKSLAPAEHAYVVLVLASTDAAFEAWGDGKPAAQPSGTPEEEQARAAVANAQLHADQLANQQQQAQAQAQAQLLQQQQAQAQLYQAQAQLLQQQQALAQGRAPLQAISVLNPFAAFGGGGGGFLPNMQPIQQLPLTLPLAPPMQPGHPLPPLKPYEKCLKLLTEALLSGGFIWPPTYRTFAMERLWMAATKSDSNRLMVGPNNSVIMQDDSWTTKDRDGVGAIEDFREGFDFILGHMAMIGMDARIIEDRRAWLKFWMNDIKSLPIAARLKAAEVFILRHSSSTNWMSCIGSNPTLWIRAASDSLPDVKRNNNGSNNNNNNNNANNNNTNNKTSVGKNNAKNRKRKLRNRGGGGGGTATSRSRSRSLSPPAKRTPTPKQGPLSDPAHPNRVSGVCDSRTHKRGCSAEKSGRKCSLSHECPRCPGQDHNMRDCPKA